MMTSDTKIKLTKIESQSILTKASGFLSGYDYTLNPYIGCGFGCSYCFAVNFLSDDDLKDNWGNWVKAKTNTREYIEKRLKRKPDCLDGKAIYMSSATDAYQPAEYKLGLTRGVLELLAEKSAPRLVVQTRSPVVVRDMDLFRLIESNGGRVQVNMTVTTDDEDVRRTFEGQCPNLSVRLRAIKKVQEAGIQSCITMTPLLLVSDDDKFVDDLLDTGVQKFIVQPSHFRPGEFVASTRQGAMELMAKKLDCSDMQVKQEYMQRYQRTLKLLHQRLPLLGEGQLGFAPPF